MNKIWQFSKMHGLGNDYIYFNCTELNLPNPNEVAKKLADRHFGIGGDGIVLIMKSEVADFRMRMFNADGSESEMCGNAIRCIGKYVYDKKLTNKTSIGIETLAGIMLLELDLENQIVKNIRVNMGQPILDAAKIPTTSRSETYIAQNYQLAEFKAPITCVSMGNPHGVFFLPKVEDYHVLTLGPKIEIDPLFPNRANIEFVEVINREYLKMRVWERGSGETLACGTGASAVCVAAVLNNLAERKVTIELLGGKLEVEWSEIDNCIYQRGPAEFAFEGTVNI